MVEVTSSSFLSIGEVLGLLLEEFPDVTISKIRFLESQGLISPERTPSGYRKFYADDVDLLRVILTEQRQNYLPLRVIKDRLANGEIDPTGEHLRPEDELPDATAEGSDVRTASNGTHHGDDVMSDPDHADLLDEEVPATSIASHPASRHQPVDDPHADTKPGGNGSMGRDAHEELDERSAAERVEADALMPGVLLDRAEMCAMVDMTESELAQLESFGIVTARDSGAGSLFDDDAVDIARTACQFLRLGVDARHLRSWRTSAEREASLYEQLITPRFRQRNPEARAEALERLRRLDALGGELRAALTRQSLRHHFES